ncbi:MAG TPA: acetate--CoA ligase family protein [Burkholderiales bacterium]|nr:acetate--CoA ligase family protein [Burkholderiales bacterium]
MSLFQALFTPRTIALVGASGDSSKATARPQKFLKKHGYTGDVFPVNPGRSVVFDLPCFKSVVDTKAKIEHAFIMVEDVEGALEDCGRAGVPVATIFSDGFADRGAAGAARQAKLAARAKKLGVRLVGPNSMGVINLPAGVTVSVNAVLEADAPAPGGASVVSQSGTMLGTLLTRGTARGLGFAKLVSVGNEIDIGVGELVEMLVADPDTKQVLLFLETVRDAERLAAAARAAHAAGKPVVAYKLGRSRLGERLARTHTGAIAGEDAALDAYFRDCGIARVDMLETLIEIAPLLSGQKPPRLGRAPRVSVLTNTGGGAAVVVDRLGEKGIEAVVPAGDAPIIDTTMGKALAAYGQTLNELLAWPGCDAVLAVTGSSAFSRPKEAIAPIVAARRGGKPLAVFLTPQADEALALLAGAGIAAFRTPEACADALGAYFNWKRPRKLSRKSALEWPKALPRRGRLDEMQGLALFKSLGMTVVEHALAKAPRYAHKLAYPVAVKIFDSGIDHKTEAGGVALGVEAGKFAAKARALGRRGKPVLVQAMQAGLGEAIVGYRDDPVAGPVAMVGAGGTLAELYNDVVLRLAPVSEAEALEMIGQVKGLAPLAGYRRMARGDLRALARAVAAISRLALVAGRPVREAEANPVIVKKKGAVAVDALVVLKE